MCAEARKKNFRLLAFSGGMSLSLLNSFTLCVSHVEVRVSRMLNKYYDDAFYLPSGGSERARGERKQRDFIFLFIRERIFSFPCVDNEFVRRLYAR